MNAAHLEFCASPEWRQIVEEMVLPAALRDLDLGDNLVEVGPGPGFTTDVLRSRVDRVTAVELDPALAEALAQRLSGTNVTVLQGDATNLALPADQFASGASFNMLHHIPTDEAQNRVISELARVVRPGGVVVAADSVASDDLRAFHDGDTYNPIDPAGLSARLEAAGFTDVDVRLYDLGWTSTARAS